jgi:hypothetical protein
MFYYFVFLTLSLLICLEPKKPSRQEKLLFLVLHFTILLLFVGLRDKTGTDWVHYSTQFFTDSNDHMEFGYLFISNLFRWLVSDYNIFVFFYTAIYLSVFFLAINNKIKIGYIILLLYTGHLLGMMGSNRQVLALMICILAGEKLYYGKIKTFIALVLFASAFHVSSFAFFLMYFIKKLSARMTVNKYILIFIAFSVINYILLSSSFINSISIALISLFAGADKTHGQLIVYASDQYRPELLTSVMMLVKRMSTLIFLFVMIRLFINKNVDVGFSLLGPRFKFYFSAYFFSIALLLLVQPIFPLISTRGGQYFYIYEIFLFSIIVSRIRQVNYLIFTALFILFCFIRLSLQFTHDAELLLPYKAVWYNTEVERRLY